MKKIYTLISLTFICLLSNAAIHSITVRNYAFVPASINAVCGDTIIWIWQSGTHTTTSTTLPSCAAAWDAPIDVSSPTFAITVSCAGTYNYECSPHASMGMVGTITVICSDGISDINTNYHSAAYPNPFSGRISIEASKADMIVLYNLVGEKLKTVALRYGQIKTEIDAADLREGIYFYCIIKEGMVLETKKIVKN